MIVRLDELLRKERFHGVLLGLYGPELMPAQLPVLTSQWSKYYFTLLWRCTLAGPVPPYAAGLEVALDERGLPVAFASEAGPSCADVAQVLEEHLRPMVSRLAVLGDVSTAVLWGNAGDCLDQQLAGADPAARQLLERPDSPLYGSVRLEPGGRRVRRSCCLSYKVEWVGHCAHCPLSDGNQAQ